MSIGTSFGSDQQYTTDDASWHDAFTIEVPDGNTASLRLIIMARGYDDAASAIWIKTGCVKKLSTTVSLIPTNLLDDIVPQKNVAALLWDARVQIDGNNMVVQVKGSGTQNVGWTLEGNVMGFVTYHDGGVT